MSPAPESVRIPPRGDEALDRPRGRLRVGARARVLAEAAVGLLRVAHEPDRARDRSASTAAGHERLQGRTGVIHVARHVGREPEPAVRHLLPA